MNIFFLDRDVAKCAHAHADQHVTKMILEYAQLLSTAHYILDGVQVGYKPTHKNHPCAVWVRKSSQHYAWLLRLFNELLCEYMIRYPGKIHKTGLLYPTLAVAPKNLADNGWTDPPQCMPDDSKALDTVAAYRQYYLKHKTQLLNWKINKPEWVNERV